MYYILTTTTLIICTIHNIYCGELSLSPYARYKTGILVAMALFSFSLKTRDDGKTIPCKSPSSGRTRDLNLFPMSSKLVLRFVDALRNLGLNSTRLRTDSPHSLQLLFRAAEECMTTKTSCSHPCVGLSAPSSSSASTPFVFTIDSYLLGNKSKQ